MSSERLHDLRKTLLTAYESGALWGYSRPQSVLPEGVERGDEQHLIFLTLVYAISGGRNGEELWSAARDAFKAEPDLFDPKTLAYAQPQAFVEPLQRHKLSKKRKLDGVTWHKIGKAIMMRGQGSVKTILSKHNYDAPELLAMLAKSKTTFPVLSGPQTSARWLWGLATVGDQPLTGSARLPIQVSATIEQVLTNLQLNFDVVSVEAWEAMAILEKEGCSQREIDEPSCSVAYACPLVTFCQYRP